MLIIKDSLIILKINSHFLKLLKNNFAIVEKTHLTPYMGNLRKLRKKKYVLNRAGRSVHKNGEGEIICFPLLKYIFIFFIDFRLLC